MRKILLLIVGFLAAILLITAGASAWQHHAKVAAARKTADTFVSYILNAEGDKAYAMLLPATQQDLNKDQWNVQTNKLSIFFYKQSPAFVTTVDNASSFTVSYDIKGTDGTYTFKVMVVNETNKSWRVQQFTSTPNS